MEPNKAAGTADLWYVDNYILLKDYYDRTISRIAARCVRKGNIAIEDYPFFGYILDVLEEISETGECGVSITSLNIKIPSVSNHPLDPAENSKKLRKPEFRNLSRRAGRIDNWPKAWLV